ncbi:ATP-binding cassette domain-containing protein [Nonomuraea endophytica]|uniref:ABC-2 type transport system ATP-binding protein n=1 Tax=Nonomuraea endophytica TaxID=714136 RepID=A0A7W7ZXR3_9ACTN|nr:ATP-binding cassette domain-containing protein [Nonomuraea endophytica]MBB5075394.1 ABC-2 type transport system ATP-binding protein [Nonomuraea endophytica]
MRPAIRTDNLTQGYGGNPIIENLTIEIDGGIVGLLGPNGAGKTTLLRTLATVLPPRSGQVQLFGKSLDGDADVRAARRHLGFLPQEFGYYPNFSLYEFVRYCLWLRQVPGRRAREAAMDAIEAVDLGDQAKTKMKALSGGMLRRAGIAQAVAGGVRLVLLDEPTVGLDPEQRLAFRELMRRVSAEATIVLSTHLVEDVAAICDRLHVIASGAFGFSGTPDELIGAAVDGARGDTELERGYISVLRDERVRA